tara:strand:+ start:3961 stop:4260 length:300 start_codon:yes stop_codon:yes gene_type:complete
MPANKKYLSSNWQRFAKITAGIIGGYLVTISFHLALACFFDRATIIITSTFTGFILWVVLMILAFIFKNGWKTWIFYVLIAVVFSTITYLSKTYNPIEF